MFKRVKTLKPKRQLEEKCESLTTVSQVALDQDSLCNISGYEASTNSKTGLPSLDYPHPFQKIILWLLQNELSDKSTIKKYLKSVSSRLFPKHERQRKKKKKDLKKSRRDKSPEPRKRRLVNGIEVEKRNSYINLGKIDISDIVFSNEHIFKVKLDGKKPFKQFKNNKLQDYSDSEAHSVEDEGRPARISPPGDGEKKKMETIFAYSMYQTVKTQTKQKVAFSDASSADSFRTAEDNSAVSVKKRMKTLKKQKRELCDVGEDYFDPQAKEALRAYVFPTSSRASSDKSDKKTVRLFRAKRFHASESLMNPFFRNKASVNSEGGQRSYKTRRKKSSGGGDKVNLPVCKFLGDNHYDEVRSIIGGVREKSKNEKTQVNIHLTVNEIYTLRWINCYLFSTDILAPYHLVIDEKLRESSEVASPTVSC